MYCGLEAVHGPHHVAEKQRMEYAWDVRNAETADGDSSSWSVADVVMMDCLSFVFFCFLLFSFVFIQDEAWRGISDISCNFL